MRSLSYLIACLLLVCAESSAQCVSVGAIRWDAWHGGSRSAVGKAVEQSLSPAEFRDRLPFCSSIDPTGTARVDCATDEAMRLELRAANARIDYWAFVAYPESHPLSDSLKLYLRNTDRHSVGFSIIVTPNLLWEGSRETFEEASNRLVRYFRDPRHHRVLGGRPLLFLLMTRPFEDHPDATRRFLERTIAKTEEHGGQRPYIVLMDANLSRAASASKLLGADAVSAYALHGDAVSATYASLTELARSHWQRAGQLNLQVIPTAMAGWDRRPRVLNPAPWESSLPRRPNEGQYFYGQPSPRQLASHIQDAVDWAAANLRSAEARTVIVYAWNENDEGGWLVPTIRNGEERLAALDRLDRRCALPAAR